MKNPSGKRIQFMLIVLAIIFAAIQFIRPGISNTNGSGDFAAPPQVSAIITRACYDCHSNQTNLQWYDQIAPVYWQVVAHIKDGREGLNFSNWKSMPPADQKAKLWEAVNQIISGDMPLKSYTTVHPAAKLSAGDVIILKTYVMSLAPKNKPGDTTKLNAVAHQFEQVKSTPSLFNKLPVALNGVTYIPGYKNWQAISTTDRFDNGTMRVIFGNSIAIKAIQTNNIKPWPNGTVFAKVAWDQVEDPEGNIKTGTFKQIEYMIKDDDKYAATKGWGFARFKTLKMIPYGKTALFTTECVDCHTPQKDEDYVFTQPIKH